MNKFKEFLTDPREHNPDDFIYLVHGLVNWDFSDFGKELSREQVAEKIDLIKNPKSFLDTSLIANLNEDAVKNRMGWKNYSKVCQLGTFSDVGLIISPASDSLIKIAWNCDVGTPMEQEEREKFVSCHRGKIKPVSRLLTDVKGSLYNHIILQGNYENEIKGIFYNHEKSNHFAERLEKILNDVLQEEIPIIKTPRYPSASVFDELAFLKSNFEIDQAINEFNNYWKSLSDRLGLFTSHSLSDRLGQFTSNYASAPCFDKFKDKWKLGEGK